MGKSKIEVEWMDDGGLLLTRKKGKITYAEAYEELARRDVCGPHWIFMRVLYGDYPEELFDDGESWEIYSGEQIADGIAVQKAYDAGFEDGKKYAIDEMNAGRKLE